MNVFLCWRLLSRYIVFLAAGALRHFVPEIQNIAMVEWKNMNFVAKICRTLEKLYSNRIAEYFTHCTEYGNDNKKKKIRI